MSKTQTIVFTGFLVSLTVLLARILAIQLPFIRISFEFFPIAIAALLMGPVIGGITGAVADVIGASLFASGRFFPGFTISAFLTGIIYGLMLHGRPMSKKRAFVTALIKTVVVDLVLVTAWLFIMYRTPFPVLLWQRLAKFAVILPLETIFLYLVAGPLLKVLQKRLSSSP
ncbi:MAG: folate family ECF transporter S component [Clostridia bacterium]